MDEKDFTTIINRTKDTVLSAIERYLAARFYSAVDDVAQEVYLRAYKSLSKDQFTITKK
jgi:RNA polymerase sigma-70 factor (ECF subfamily)